MIPFNILLIISINKEILQLFIINIMKSLALLTFLLLMISQISISQILPFRRDRNDDDTAEFDTDSSIEDAVEEKGLRISADFRPIFDYFDLEERDASTDNEVRLGGRLRLRGAVLPNDRFSRQR